MGVPILKQGRYLIATIQSALSDADLLVLRNELVARVGRYRSHGVIVDVTSLDVLDSFATRTLSDSAQMIRLRGAQTLRRHEVRIRDWSAAFADGRRRRPFILFRKRLAHTITVQRAL